LKLTACSGAFGVGFRRYSPASGSLGFENNLQPGKKTTNAKKAQNQKTKNPKISPS
jgi:hypothetical protein